MNIRRILLRIARILGLLLVGVWGWYLAAMFRTTGWGYDQFAGEIVKSLLALSVFALPIAFLPLIGVAWRPKLAAIGIWTCLCLFAVESFARGQEYLLIRHLGRQPSQSYTETRWWPFQHHSLGFVQGEWWGCD
jgi:hypothetical protein